ncbi:FtsH protease activity modulator HflK [Sphingorhabdus sp.]|uniref:FtsH protease activity modulator HflK n=1 Tax=Sphingorhabdus sp. TaxID=1902408 RepID=UPI0035942C6C
MSKKIDQQGSNILAVDGKGPWDSPASGDPGKIGKTGGSGSGESGSKPEPSNPWDPVPIRGGQAGRQRGPSLEDLLRRASGGKNGGFSGLPPRSNGKSWWPIIGGAFIALWLVWSSVHRIGPEQEGVVTQLGRYARTLQPGIQFTFPSPIEAVEKVDTKQIQTTAVGSPKASSENLVLTKDQSIIDMAYDVRWSIKEPELYLFQLENADSTVKEVAESAMRAAVANFDLTQAIGPGRGAIELEVRRRMQQVLDEYRSGVLVQSISIRQSDPPAEVNDAFREVNAAQQRRESYMNDARAYASRVTELAIGETTEFDKIYVQYREAPEVTKRRLYYETMEQVLGKVDKTIVETGGVTPYLPLPEFQKKAAPKNETVTVTGKK